MTIALVESETAGRPQPRLLRRAQRARCRTPTSSWRGDPASFDSFPEFFLAHELAHQWWGQAVGWKNYHEQWLSEGFAQYFAALSAQQSRGDRVFGDMLRQFRRWSLSRVGPGAGAPRLPPGPHQERPARLPRARLQQGRGRAAHAAPAAGRRGLLRAACAGSTTTGGSRRRAPTTSSARWRPSRAAPSTASSSGGSTAPTSRASPINSTIGDGQVTVRFEQPADHVFDLPVTVTLTVSRRQDPRRGRASRRGRRRADHSDRRPRPPGAGEPGRRRPGGVRGTVDRAGLRPWALALVM